MNPPCAACKKTVYPTEKLNCLDKIWHKGCFKCQACHMTLNMKNYKGYDKMPYCNAHYPTTKHTQVADTPEARRIAENTKIQSNIKYHEDFERQKGKKMSVVDDPETLRLAQNQMTASQIAYKGIIDQKEFQESVRPQSQINEEMQRRRSPGKISEYQPPVPDQGYQGRPPSSGLAYDSRSGQDDGFRGDDEFQNGGAGARRRQPGSITEYDPENDKWGSLTGQAPAPQRYAPAPSQNYPPPQPQQPAYQPPPPQMQPPRAPQQQQQQQQQSTKGMMCKAIYDYTAADTDEVSFVEDDIIVYCQPVDEGWMMGTVERSGQRGMLPSNYVERIN